MVRESQTMAVVEVRRRLIVEINIQKTEAGPRHPELDFGRRFVARPLFFLAVVGQAGKKRRKKPVQGFEQKLHWK